MIKVAIDEHPLKSGHAVRGIGTYTRNLIEVLREKNDIKLVDLNEADVAHFPYFDLFFDTLHPPPKPTVVTIFDVIPLIYPKHYPPGIKGRIRFLKQKAELGRVAAVITISETSKKDIVRFLDIPPEKIYVIQLAPAEYFRKLPRNSTILPRVVEKYRLPQRFVLYVGDVNYNKNLLGLVEACKLIKMPLVIVGKQATDTRFDHTHPENQALVQLIEKYGDDPAVLRLGFIPQEDLVAIYNLTTVYCQPSFYEGFGLPVLEAMACGLPVVAAKTQALVEIAEGVALFANPQNPRDIADKIMQVVSGTKLRNNLIKRGLAHARQFSWDKVADETIKVYQAVVG